jgi:AAA15 family ATPase/GTPase
MLLEFRAKNYKSFKEELVFSMRPAPKQKGLDYSVLKQKIGKATHKALCSAVLYGPNASGKTNIIGAMDTFKNIILRGNIRNSDVRDYPNDAAKILELIPNNRTEERYPVLFSITFIENKVHVEYTLAADIGAFLDKNYVRKITFEQLKINEDIIFTREGSLYFDSLASIKKFQVNEFGENERSAISLATSNLHDEELFLTNGFKTMFSTKLVSLITGWLENKFMVIYRADAMELIKKFVDPAEKSIYIEKTINEAASLFGVTSNRLGYAVNDNKTEARLHTLLKNKTEDKGVALPAEVFESYGTVRFINIFPLVVNTILNGGTLVVDEFDASIHPMALMSIINIYHNDEINVHKAQLIFDTHNPIFLNSNLFRRDEIKFTDRDDDTGYSVHYSLSDFGTSGENGVRKTDDYMKNYFISQYGAIKDIDFTPVLADLIGERYEV